MTNRVFKLQDIGEGVVEGEVVEWHVAVGDSVSEDDALVDVMTDKATVTIPSPHDGTIAVLHGDVGDMIAVGAALVEFGEGGDSHAKQQGGGSSSSSSGDGDDAGDSGGASGSLKAGAIGCGCQHPSRDHILVFACGETIVQFELIELARLGMSPLAAHASSGVA